MPYTEYFRPGRGDPGDLPCLSLRSIDGHWHVVATEAGHCEHVHSDGFSVYRRRAWSSICRTMRSTAGSRMAGLPSARACFRTSRQAALMAFNWATASLVCSVSRALRKRCSRLLGQIQEGHTINVAVLPEWHGIRQQILEAPHPYPEARLAVAQALQGEARP